VAAAPLFFCAKLDGEIRGKKTVLLGSSAAPLDSFVGYRQLQQLHDLGVAIF